jgi:hypothetical protein
MPMMRLRLLPPLLAGAAGGGGGADTDGANPLLGGADGSGGNWNSGGGGGVGNSTALAPTMVGCEADSGGGGSTGKLPMTVGCDDTSTGAGGGTGSIGGSTGSMAWLLNMVGCDEESAGAGGGASGGDVSGLPRPGMTTVASDNESDGGCMSIRVSPSFLPLRKTFARVSACDRVNLPTCRAPSRRRANSGNPGPGCTALRR